MKHLLPLALLLAPPAFAQTKLNLPLKRELDSIYVQDQRYREMMMTGMGPGKAEATEAALHLAKGELGNYLSTNMIRTDSSDMRRVAAIVRRYGYPGKSLVGTPTNEAVWWVIQHSNKIPQYLPLLKAAAETGELPFYRYAQMLDRQLMNDGQEQLYGTQGKGYTVPNPATGAPENIRFIWPIKEAARVNERRKQAGFPTTVEENGAAIGIPYQPVTLDYAKQVQRRAQGR
ncbi:DUF6624 domain-containing protein [Hymenobacter sp. PAMC 26628]|uniref:DUF6624 domain-containing protein n=1 Tax=Hymenobacter sp. PAMC 26628 TaxID=1484118 RepID=UPI000770120E|nr:DUF6624 domain-containing protein [Hymenobacter sp. PAMC 26628]AMJ64374.1 hypothetical protein AXW84_02240 [Hymenobacter sp. PAMC 26628]